MKVLSEELCRAIEMMLVSIAGPGSSSYEERRVIVQDLLWKLARRDYHGVADCAMDLRELHL